MFYHIHSSMLRDSCLRYLNLLYSLVTCFYNNHLRSILTCMRRSPKWPFIIWFLNQNFVHISYVSLTFSIYFIFLYFLTSVMCLKFKKKISLSSFNFYLLLPLSLPYIGMSSATLLFHHLLLNMFRMLVHPSSGACDLFVELFHVLYCSGSMCVGVTVWFGWGGVVSLCRQQYNT